MQIKKQAAKTLKQEHKQEIEDLTSKFNSQVENEVEKHSKEKSKMEKELKSMRKRAEKAELELSKAESLKSSAASNGASSEAFFQDILVNLKEFMGDQLQCSICNEIYVFPTSLNCGHSFCEDCIGKLLQNSKCNYEKNIEKFVEIVKTLTIWCLRDFFTENSTFIL